jgi:hypothetical protein
MAKFDRNASYQTVFPPGWYSYEQKGHFFNQAGEEVFDPDQPRPAPAPMADPMPVSDPAFDAPPAPPTPPAPAKPKPVSRGAFRK